MELLVRWNNMANDNPTTIDISMPTLAQIKRKYHELAKRCHPDRRPLEQQVSKTNVQGHHHHNSDSGKLQDYDHCSPSVSQWNSLQEAYQLLMDWWKYPTVFD
jgi:hypothetical protein